jgi:hypothetical protein
VIPLFLIVKSVDECKTLSSCNPYLILKNVKRIAREPHSIKKLRHGTLLIHCQSEDQATKLLRVQELCSLAVTVSGHASLNVCKGDISCFDLLNAPVEQIKKNMKRYKVVEVKRILSRKSGSLEPTPALIVSFALPSLPVEVKCAYYNLKVRPYIPNPMRCFKIKRFGHTQSRRTKPTICPDCGLKEHESTQCEGENYCVNCKGDHSASRQSWSFP